VGIIPKFRDGEGERLGGYIFGLLSLIVCTNSGIAKRPILLSSTSLLYYKLIPHCGSTFL
jgi:hypothetical protein